MKREIKFRVWIKSQQYMDFPTSITIDDSGHVEGVRGYGGEYPYTDIELMQFTGLKDKNGREIHESDIVRTGNDNIGDPEPMIGQVIMREGSWLIENEKKQEAMELFSEITSREVVGNIYENPELLEADIQ